MQHLILAFLINPSLLWKSQLYNIDCCHVGGFKDHTVHPSQTIQYTYPGGKSEKNILIKIKIRANFLQDLRKIILVHKYIL